MLSLSCPRCWLTLYPQPTESRWSTVRVASARHGEWSSSSAVMDRQRAEVLSTRKRTTRTVRSNKRRESAATFV